MDCACCLHCLHGIISLGSVTGLPFGAMSYTELACESRALPNNAGGHLAAKCCRVCWHGGATCSLSVKCSGKLLVRNGMFFFATRD